MRKKTMVHVSLTRGLAMAGIALTVLFTMLLVTGCKNDNNQPKTYDVTIIPNVDGEITSNPKKAAEGKPVTVTVKPKDGKALDKLNIHATKDTSLVEEVVVVQNEDGSSEYTFNMPSGGVIVSATFVDTWVFAITISPDIQYGTVTSRLRQQYSGWGVTLRFNPSNGYRYYPGSLRVETLFADEEDNYLVDYIEEISPTEATATFIMPQAPVFIYATFTSSDIPMHNIDITQTAHGKINSIYLAAADTTVQVDLQPDAGYRYKSGSIAATGISNFTELPASGGPNGLRRFSFKMPANDITLTAAFELIPTYTVTLTKDGTFGQWASFTAAPLTVDGKGGEDNRITLLLTMNDPANYRYEPDSFTISDNVTDLVELAPGSEWAFTMPAGAVTATVNIIEVDRTKPLNNVSHGALTGGTITFITQLVDGQARQDDTVIFEAKANTGQIIRGNPSSVPSVLFTKMDDGTATDTTGRWYFIMPNRSIIISISFAADSSEYRVDASSSLQGILTIGGLNGQRMARVGALVTVTAAGNPGYEPDGIPSSDPPLTFTPYGSTGRSWQFTMPKSEVVVSMDYRKTTFSVDKGSVSEGGDISFSGAYNGIFPGEAQKGLSVTITATPEPGYKTQGNPTVDVEGVAVTGSGPWTFTMPAQDVQVSMSFELATFTLAVGTVQYGTLSITSIGGTPINTTNATAKMGETILVSATPLDQYEIDANIPTVTVVPSVQGGVSPSSTGTGYWQFTMPPGNVTLGMTFSRVHYAVPPPPSNPDGSITIGGLRGDGKAPMGAAITITASPNSGMGADTPVIRWTVAGQAQEESAVYTSKNNWSFVMKGYPVTIDVAFGSQYVKTGSVQIYSNGQLLEGLSLASEYYYAGSTNPDSVTNITNGGVDTQFNVSSAVQASGGSITRNNNHTQAIIIKAIGNGTERKDIGFSLVKTGPKVDLSGTSGLSFMLYYPGNFGESWYPINWIGFGDINNDSKGVMHMGGPNSANFIWGNTEEHEASQIELQQPQWRRVIVPVPKVSDHFEVSNVFNIRVGLRLYSPDEYFLIDDIEFLKGDALSLTDIRIRDTWTPPSTAAVNAASIVSRTEAPIGIRFTYTTTSASGINPVISSYIYSENINVNIGNQQTFAPWGLANDYVFQVMSGAATLSGSGGNTMVTPGSGTSRLVLKIGSVTSNEMTISP